MLEICDLAASTSEGLYERGREYVMKVQAQVLSEAVTLLHFLLTVEKQPYLFWLLMAKLTSSGPGLSGLC